MIISRNNTEIKLLNVQFKTCFRRPVFPKKSLPAKYTILAEPIQKVKVAKLIKFPVLFNLFCGHNKLLCHKVWARPDYVCHQNFYSLPISRLANNYFYFCAQFVLNVYQTILQPFYKDFMQINQEIPRT